MTLAELNRHYELRDRLARARETVASMRQRARPAAAALTGMPHTPGVSDRVGDLAVEIADMEAYIRYTEEEIRQAEPPILSFIESIADPQLRSAFRLRFIRALTWAETAAFLKGGNTESGVKMMCYRYLAAEDADETCDDM